MPIVSIKKILNSFTTSMSNLDKEWVRFIKDHKQILLDSSNKIEITQEVVDKYQYKIHHFLIDQNLDQDIHWVVMIINDLNNLEDFSFRKFIYIPSGTEIANLFQIYKTTRKYKK